VAELIVWSHDRRHPDPYPDLDDTDLAPIDLDDDTPAWPR